MYSGFSGFLKTYKMRSLDPIKPLFPIELDDFETEYEYFDKVEIEDKSIRPKFVLQMEPYLDHWEFEDLPFDVLESIFKYLDANDLKNLLYIPRFQEVIQISPATMRKLPLILTENWQEKLNFVEIFGDFVKEVIVTRCTFEKPCQFRDLISNMRNVETIRLLNVQLKAENLKKKFKVVIMKFPKLKNIQLDNSQAVVKLMKNLKKVQVREMRLDFSHLTNTDAFTDFLCCQESLDKLTISGWDNIVYRSLFLCDISYRVCFDLLSLKIMFKLTPNENFKRFLMNQPWLEELELHKEVLDEEIFNMIFKMESLKSLLLRTNFVTLKNIDLKKVSQSRLTELTLITRSEYGVDQTINTFVSRLFSLKTLNLINLKTDSSDQLLAFVHLKKLEKLYVENSKMKFIQNIKLECLKELHIKNLHLFLKLEDWENFLRNNSGIQELSIHGIECYYNIDHIRQEIHKIIHNIEFILKNLKRLEIFQEIRYQKPIKLDLRIRNGVKSLKISDSFIKHCREDFHFLRKILADGLLLCYYSDDDL